MDVFPIRPTAVQGIPQAASASQDKLAEGRIFAAQVVALLDGGSLILGVGRERIAATSQAALQPGQKLFLKVRGSGASRVFELVDQVAIEDHVNESLEVLEAQHPFRWLAQGRGLGELLADLSRALTARGEESPAIAKELACALEQLALVPGESGAELARKLSNSGLSHETRMLARAFENLAGTVVASAGEEVVALAFAAIEVADEIEPARRALGAELARSMADASKLAELRGSPSEGRGLASKVLGEWIGPALEHSLAEHFDKNVRARIAESLMLARLSPRLARAVLEALLGERAALARTIEEPSASSSGLDAPDLKQWLSTALAELDPGPERTAVRAAYEALEAEQFIALARASHGDGSSWVLALRDGQGLADARLVHRRTREREVNETGVRERKVERAVLGLAFSRTGPVRAEFALDGNHLHVRVGVSSDEVAEHMNAALDELAARLRVPGRSVQLIVGVRAAEDLRVPGAEADDHLNPGRAAVDQFG